LQIVQTNGAAEDAADRAHTKTHLQIVGAFAGLLEFLAAGKALGNRIRLCYKAPDGQSRSSIEFQLALGSLAASKQLERTQKGQKSQKICHILCVALHL